MSERDNDSCALCLLQVHLSSAVLRCKLPNAEVKRAEKRKIDADARRGQGNGDISLAVCQLQENLLLRQW